MAFSIYRFTRVSLADNTGALTGVLNPSTTTVVFNGPAFFTYASADDTISQISAANYFASQVDNLAIGDVILAVGSDASNMLQVSAVDRTARTVAVVSFTVSGSVGTANITNLAVTTAKIADANVTLAKLAAGIAPSHVIKFANQVTTVGGAAAEAFTVTGAVAATDRAFVQVVDNGTANVTVLQAVVTTNTLTVTFSGNPGADTIINYQLIRAAS